MRWIDVIVSTDQLEGFGLGVDIHMHRHNGGPFHGHLWLTFAWWYFELRVGRDQLKEN